MKKASKVLQEAKTIVDQQMINAGAGVAGKAGDPVVTEWVSQGERSIRSITKIPGDASARSYYRVESGDGKSYILMKTDPFADQGESLPFLIMQQHLAKCGVDVPRVFDVDAARGCILLEDLGDITLLRRLQDVANEQTERHLYQQVIDSLVEMHVQASPGPNHARFDYEKLMWEMGFTIEHFYEKYLGRELKEADRATMNAAFGEICRILAAEPVVFTHRDFHSRNVMVLPEQGGGDRFVMIDFQDARLGPAQYDLASLLRDSYYQLEEAQIERLLDYYVVKWEASTMKKLDRAHFRHIFDLMSVQRNFKAIGSFASFLNRRGNATYLKYIGNTFENIRRTLLKYPQYAQLREVLFHYYYF